MESAAPGEDTIAAICTPPGEGGVGIVRLSGPGAQHIGAAIFRSAHGRPPVPGRRGVYHGHVVGADGAAIDEVLLNVMPGPRSYTREDVVEINAHGGAGPLNVILEEALRLGARLARPGEFTLRAFLHGRIDLVQAEAVIDQIRARTRAGLQAAQAAARGALSRDIHALRDTLAGALARVEAVVDFPEEDDVPELISPALLADLRAAHDRMRGLIATADAGRLLREGAAIAVAGRPNVGKSSLFNALLRDARAIVSAQPGTTRDRLEDWITLGGIPAKLVDTAGLRETDDEVERIGVARAREALREAQAIVFVIDAAAGVTAEDAALARELAGFGVPRVLACNKIDLAPGAPTPSLPWEPAAVCAVSALTGAGLGDLESALSRLLLGGAHLAADGAMLNRAHQKDSLRRAEAGVARVLDDPGQSPEFLALDLREALQALGEITGETTPDDLLGMIFEGFCIGK